MQIPIHFHPNGNFTQRTNYDWIEMRCTIWTSYDSYIFPNVSLIHYGGHRSVATAAGFQPNIHYYSFIFSIFFFKFSFSIIHLNLKCESILELCSIDWLVIESYHIGSSMSCELWADPFYDWFIYFYCQKFNFTEKYQYALCVNQSEWV